MKWWGWLLVALLVALVAFQGFWLYLLLIDGMEAFPTSEDRRMGNWVGLGLGALIYGLVVLLRRVRQPAVAPDGEVRVSRRLERRILELARKQQGRLTVAEVALHAKVSVQEADLALRELVRQGVATVQYTPNMEAVYIISGFDQEAQARAQDILNP